MFLVFQIILNMNFPDVYCSNLRMNNLLSSSFFGQKGRRTVRTRCSLKSHSGMMLSSSASAAVWKSLITASTNLLGYPTLVNFFLILTISVEKSEAILCALCSSPVIAFRLYRLGTLEDQKTGSLPGFSYTDVTVSPFTCEILVSRNLLGFSSTVCRIFGWYELRACKSSSGIPFFLLL